MRRELQGIPLYLCCAEEAEVALLPVIDALHRGGVTPEVVVGLEHDPKVLCNAIDLGDPRGVFVLCVNQDLPSLTVRKLAGLFSARRAPGQRWVTVPFVPNAPPSALIDSLCTALQLHRATSKLLSDDEQRRRDVVGVTQLAAIPVDEGWEEQGAVPSLEQHLDGVPDLGSVAPDEVEDEPERQDPTHPGVDSRGDIEATGPIDPPTNIARPSHPSMMGQPWHWLAFGVLGGLGVASMAVIAWWFLAPPRSLSVALPMRGATRLVSKRGQHDDPPAHRSSTHKAEVFAMPERAEGSPHPQLPPLPPGSTSFDDHRRPVKPSPIEREIRRGHLGGTGRLAFSLASTESLTWTAALHHCEVFERGDVDGFRLPTEAELRRLRSRLDPGVYWLRGAAGADEAKAFDTTTQRVHIYLMMEAVARAVCVIERR